MRRLGCLLLVLLLAGTFTGCRQDSSSLYAVSKTQEISPRPTTETLYGKSLLNPLEQTAYDTVLAAIQDMREVSILPPISGDALRTVLVHLRRDHPQIDWLKDEYSYSVTEAETTVRLQYSPPAEGLFESIRLQEDAAAALLQYIPTELSDFDKALCLHDRLVEHITYNRNASRPNTLAGALIDRQATCEGYARAYQYLLNRLGLEALIVYGQTEEPHAWNMVRLDGAYYHCDLTWDDLSLEDGSECLSHEYLFRDDTYFFQTHTPLTDGTNYPLPACRNNEQNYYIKTGTLLQTADPADVETVFLKAANLTAGYGYSSIQIGLADNIADKLENTLLADGTLDTMMRDICHRKGWKLRGRSFSHQRTALMYQIQE